MIKINKVTDSCIIKYEEREVCVIDNNYSLLQYVPFGENYVLTIFFDDKNNIIQWYFDITYRNGIDDDGIPYYDDLYLDIIILPPFKVYLVDKDELDEALNKKIINNKKYSLACSVADRLMDDIINNRILFMERYETDLKNMLELIKEQKLY
jgi:predicted RNA-binding protein associated with RNAse of E/G family